MLSELRLTERMRRRARVLRLLGLMRAPLGAPAQQRERPGRLAVVVGALVPILTGSSALVGWAAGRDIHDPHNAAIVRTVVSLGRSLGLDVVAEGVETVKQEAYLVAEGCPLGQGYLYGKAVPASQVPGLVKFGCGRDRIAA